MKNIEDDPTITPGSVKRSPLSVAGIKETDLSLKGVSSTSSDTSTTASKSNGANGNGQGSGSGLTFNNSAWNYQNT
jgi:hypothetical protein